MKLVFIIGPFRAPTAWDIEQNVRRAEDLALDVWKLGAAAICAHTNTRFFHGILPDKVWLDGDMEILSRCDAAITVPGWEDSAGSCYECNHAETHDIAVFHCLADLDSWLNSEGESNVR